jgi:hypothetical protein
MRPGLRDDARREQRPRPDAGEEYGNSETGGCAWHRLYARGSDYRSCEALAARGRPNASTAPIRVHARDREDDPGHSESEGRGHERNSRVYCVSWRMEVMSALRFCVLEPILLQLTQFCTHPTGAPETSGPGALNPLHYCLTGMRFKASRILTRTSLARAIRSAALRTS